MFCRCANGFGGAAEHAHLPGLPRASRARCRCRTGQAIEWTSSSASRSAARSPSAPSSPARTTSIPTSRRATRSPSTTSRSAWAAGSSCRARTATARSGSCARTSRRTRRRPSTSAARTGRIHGADALARRLQPRRHAARRDRDRAGHPLGRRGAALPPAAAPDGRRARLSDAEMEKGSLRCRRQRLGAQAGEDELPHATELKNMNSFNVRRATGSRPRSRGRSAIYESRRRGRPGDAPLRPVDRDASRRSARRRRRDDYRYFPEPDLVAGRAARRSSSSGCAPSCRSCRARASAGSSRTSASFYDADGLVTGGRDRLYERVVAAGADAEAAANVLMNQLVARRRRPGAVNAAELAKLDRGARPDPARRVRRGDRRERRRRASPPSVPRARRRHRRVRARPDHRRDPRREPGPGRSVPRRQGGPARLLRRPGDEGDAAARRTRRSSTSACARSSAPDPRAAHPRALRRAARSCSPSSRGRR